MTKPTIFTIGHSTRTIGQFIALLKAHGVREVIDIRTMPGSRHNSQFGKARLEKSLKKEKIAYTHLLELGGLRRAKKDSMNLGWRNASFRGYADYMETMDFAEGLKDLIKIARRKRSAIMCAEAVPWRCHRSLVADALTKKKWKVLHIQSARTAREHRLTPFLRMKAGKITYPAPRDPIV